MMAARALERPPRILPLYARAVAPLLPGASRLPWVGGGGGEVPDAQLTLVDVPIDRDRVRAYARVCGFEDSDELPATYVHVLAFPLHLALMAERGFPFAAVGLVHVANRIVQRRAISTHERLSLRVRTTPLRPHSRGRTFSIVSEAMVAGELVWHERSTMLRRGRGTGASVAARGPGIEPLALSASGSEWRLPSDLGRRYAAASGDRNPIHLHALTARPLGFPRAIAHGMWTKARCMAALQAPPREALPGAFSVEVRFRQPIPLPASVDFASETDGTTIRFGVRSARRDKSHLDGQIEPLGQNATQREDLS